MPALGFAGAGGGVAVLALIIIWSILGFVVRRRWRIAAARRVEVMRLAMLAAEEAARAEEEAVMLVRGAGATFVVPAADVGVGGPGNSPPEFPPKCAVCFVPTTARCSRCKAVRYCSGKCQIIHWRQGHKNVCHPPQTDDCADGKASISKLEVATSEEPNLCFESLDIDDKPQREPVVTYSKSSSSKSSQSSEVFSDDEFVNAPGTDSSTDSSDSSSSSSLTFSGSVEKFDCSLSDDHHGLPYSVKIDDQSSCRASNDEFSRLGCDSEKDLNETGPSQFNGMTLPENNARCTIDYEQKAFCSMSKDMECNSSGCLSSETIDSGRFSNGEASEYSRNYKNANGGSNVSQDDMIANSTEANLSKKYDCYSPGSRSHMVASKLPDQVMPSYTSLTNEEFSEGRPQSDQASSAALVNSSGPSRGSTSSQIFQPKNLSSPVSGSADQASACGGCSISHDASIRVESTSKAQLSSQSPGSDSNGVKQSVQRVVQQLKLSKISKQHTFGLGNDSSTKFKTLFPYDNFVKLYNCDKMQLRPSGLTNCGNSCYANAVLQCLAFTPPLTAYLLQGLHSKSCPNKEWCFTCELENMLLKVKQGQSPLSPTGILSHLHRIGSHLGRGREEDAHEFLRYAIDTMQSVCLKEAGGFRADRWAEETTLIQLTFGGYLRSKIQCMKCHFKSERHERMMDLTVEIHGDIGTLEEALRRFTSTEILDGENKYHCSRCKSYERAKKKLTVLDAPNVLTIALKRFQSGKFGKLNKAIRFPEHLDLAPYMSSSVDKSPVYRLYAVVVHLDVMNAAFSGHYICYVKSTQGKWYKTDDSLVKSVELGSVLSKNAYMLFYARYSPHCPSLTRGITLQDHVISKKSRNKQSVSSGSDREKERSRASISRPGTSSIPQRSQDQPNWRTGYGFSYESSNFLDERFILPTADSSSDSSSLFSHSDEGSCSTESTRNSTSTDELSDYIFGDLDR